MKLNKNKKRLDVILVERGITETRSKAQGLIMSGKIIINGKLIDKPGLSVFPDDIEIIFKGEYIPYVSRGGLKLEKAINDFNISVKGMTCLDIGASTGGFTDCLIQCGAKKVYAVDVGYGQIAWKLRQDFRVVVIERTNIRYADQNLIPEKVDFVTIDVSFISLKIVIPSAIKFMNQNAAIIALIKPQFEVGKDKVGKGGVVRNPDLHESVINDLKLFTESLPIAFENVIPSPILGPKGNKEFLMYLKNFKI